MIEFNSGIPVYQHDISHRCAKRIINNHDEPSYTAFDRYRDLHQLAKYIGSEFDQEIALLTSARFDGSQSPAVRQRTAAKEYGIKNYREGYIYNYSFDYLDQIFQLGLTDKHEPNLRFKSKTEANYFDQQILKKTIAKLIDTLVIDSDSHIPLHYGKFLKGMRSLFKHLGDTLNNRKFLLGNSDITVQHRAKPLNLADEIFEEITGNTRNKIQLK